MKIHPGYVGIDISKQHLDIFDGAVGSAERVENTAEAIAVLARRWAQDGSFVLFEATGHYDMALRRALRAAGVAFVRVNPARARDFARAAGVLAKTDAIDARMLAAMAQSLRPATEAAADPAREQLAQLNRRRDQLVACRKQERTRLEGCVDADIRADIESHIEELGVRIGALQSRIGALVKASPAIDNAQRLLRSIPGIGPVAAATLLALMPELGARPPKIIAALAGLAPYNVDSGKHRGRRVISGGRRRVREALYMAAVTAARASRHRFGQFYRTLLAAGKPAKLALVAVARKIIVTANAVLRDNRAFQP